MTAAGKAASEAALKASAVNLSLIHISSGTLRRCKRVCAIRSAFRLTFSAAQDCISNTFSIVPGALGKDDRIFAGDLEVEMPEFEAEH